MAEFALLTEAWEVLTAPDVSKALGVVLLAAAELRLPWEEYTPPQVKSTVTGNGAADKSQVSYMLVKILGLGTTPERADESDALAVAMCHAFKRRDWGGL